VRTQAVDKTQDRICSPGALIRFCAFLWTYRGREAGRFLDNCITLLGRGQMERLRTQLLGLRVVG